MLLFSPVQLEGACSTGVAGLVTFSGLYPWQPELSRMLECASGASFDSVKLTWGLLDPRAFELMGDDFLSGQDLPDILARADQAALRVAQESASLFALVAVTSDGGKLSPVSPPARDYWQRSAGAWLRDALSREGVTCDAVRFGWPAPLRNARVQLVKGALMAYLQQLPEPLRSLFINGEVGWEPGFVLLRVDPLAPEAPHGLSECVLAVPAFGLAQDYAAYAVAQTLQTLRAAPVRHD